MKKIDTPPSHPERWPFVQYPDHPGLWVRIPTPGQGAAAMLGHQDIENATVQGEAICGSLILISWRSHTHALEATDGPGCYAELHDAGWRPERITALANFIAAELRGNTTTEADVEEAAGFTETTPAS